MFGNYLCRRSFHPKSPTSNILTPKNLTTKTPITKTIRECFMIARESRAKGKG